MAQIDSSIYQNIPDIGASFERGMRIGDLIKTRQKESAINEAYKSNLKTGEDGKIYLDQQGVVKQLGQSGYGQDAYNRQKQFQQDKLTEQENLYKERSRKNGLIASAGNVALKDPQAYGQIRNDLIKSGLVGAQDMPEQFDPNFIKSAIAQSQTYQQQLDEDYRNKTASETERHNKAGENLQSRHYSQLEKQNAFDNMVKRESIKAANNEGQKKVDTEFAKDYNEWTSGGGKSAQAEIDKLKNVVSNLKSGRVTTGGLTGLFPDRMTSNGLLEARSDVQSTVMNSLRSIMGASFTEKEGERVIKNTWNESDSTQNNMARLERLVQDLENKANDKNQKAAYFEQSGGTLGGFSPINNRSQQQNQSQKISPNEMEQAFQWAKSNPTDPRAKEIMSRMGGK